MDMRVLFETKIKDKSELTVIDELNESWDFVNMGRMRCLV